MRIVHCIVSWLKTHGIPEETNSNYIVIIPFWQLEASMFHGSQIVWRKSKSLSKWICILKSMCLVDYLVRKSLFWSMIFRMFTHQILCFLAGQFLFLCWSIKSHFFKFGNLMWVKQCDNRPSFLEVAGFSLWNPKNNMMVGGWFMFGWTTMNQLLIPSINHY